MAASPPKRCLYEILDLPVSATPDDIRSAYKKLALLRHPDKLIRSGLSESDATASFQELQNAYQVLSDPRERAWYDSHRSQILFSSNTTFDYSAKTTSFSPSPIPNLFSFFNNSVFSGYSDSGKGFYKVYSDVFDKVYNIEVSFAKKMGLGDDVVREAPVLGNLKSNYGQVNAFYGYWLGFVSVMDFAWVDEYDVRDGGDRRSRRMMEEENRKVRKRAKKEYNDTVRGLAGFVKKRDKRVVEMQVKRNEEMERKREEEKRKREEERRTRAERARAFKEEAWTKVEEVEVAGFEVEEGEEEKREFYCVVCGKKFKSEKQWGNHEQSKRHKEKVAELREAYEEEMEDEEEVEDEEGEGNGFVSADDGLDDELQEKFENCVKFEEHDASGMDEAIVEDESSVEEEEVFVDTDDGSELKGVAEKLGLDDDEASMLEAMLSGHKRNTNKKGKTMTSPTEEINVEVDDEEKEFVEYNNRKSARKNKGSRRRRRAYDEGMRGTETSKTDENSADEGAAVKGDSVKTSSSLSEEKNGYEDSSPRLEETTTSQSFVENHTKGKDEDFPVKSQKVPKPTADKKGATKKTDTKSKTAAKGRKQKTSSKGSSENTCEKCGADFESRTKLHSHLKDSGHATLKSR